MAERLSTPLSVDLDPVRLVDAEGSPTSETRYSRDLPHETLAWLYESMVVARDLDVEFVNLQRQGELALYASCRGQEAAQVGATAYAGTPSFLLSLLEKGRELGLDTSSLCRAVVSGEALGPALQQRFREEFGIDAYQLYGTADAGLIAYETTARAGLVIDEAVILEIVAPGTGDLVAEGDVGEVVITVFNPDYPLLRFATGDLSAVLPGESPCGRTNMRIRGWLGRADQTTKIRGMFVHPQQIHDVLARHPEIARARLEVRSDGARDAMTLRCEASVDGAADLTDRVAESVRALTGLRAEIELVAMGSLPADGKVIDDRRAAS